MVSYCDDFFTCTKYWSGKNSYNREMRLKRLRLVVSEEGYLEDILRRVQSPDLIWLRWYGCDYSSLPDWIPMKDLRVSEVEGSKLEILWPHQSKVGKYIIYMFALGWDVKFACGAFQAARIKYRFSRFRDSKVYRVAEVPRKDCHKDIHTQKVAWQILKSAILEILSFHWVVTNGVAAWSLRRAHKPPPLRAGGSILGNSSNWAPCGTYSTQSFVQCGQPLYPLQLHTTSCWKVLQRWECFHTEQGRWILESAKPMQVSLCVFNIP